MQETERRHSDVRRASTLTSLSRRALIMLMTLGSGVACSQDGATQTDQSNSTAPSKGPTSGEYERASTKCAEALNAFGTYYDEKHRQYVVVVPADKALPPGTVATNTCRGDLRISSSSLTRAVADEIQREVVARDFHTEARKYTYSTWLNLRSGRMVIQSDAPPYVLASLKSKFGSLVEFQEGGIVLN